MKSKTFFFLLTVIIGSLFVYYFQQQPLTLKDFIVLYGNVDVRQVDLGFRVSGRVTELIYQEGDLVKPGALLARLDIQPYADQVNQARANIDSIQVNLENAEKVYQRRKSLFELNDGSVSEEDYQNALTSRDNLRANLKQAEAALGVSLTNFTDTEVYAPNEGIILTRIREPGTVVKQGDPVYTLSLIDPIWIRAFIPEPYLGIVYPGMIADVLTDTKGGKVYKGRVGFISPVAEFTPKTVETTQLRTDLVYRLRIYIDHPDSGLRQGMPVTVHLPLKKNENSSSEVGTIE